MYHCSNPTAHYQKIRSLAPYDKKGPLENAAKFDSRHQCIISLSSGLLNSHIFWGMWKDTSGKELMCGVRVV